jgi:formylglycine-generating enzyme required for sulfatase activity
VLWRQSIAEFHHLLLRHGAFRRVRAWSLNTDSEDGHPVLHPGLGDTATRQPPRSRQELLAPGGRRLILVVTDCVSSGWHAGSVTDWLAFWGAHHPIALVQVLPERLWSGSALRVVSAIQMQSPGPDTANKRLDYTFQSPMDRLLLRRRPPAQQASRLPVPVLTLDGDQVAAWASLVTGTGTTPTSGFLLTSTPDASMPIPDEDEQPADDLSPEQLVDDFREYASPEAFRLAQLLAAAPLSLPVIRLVQRTMMPKARQGHIAEVFLSGLLRRRTPAEAAVHPEYVWYDFLAGVREVLRQGLSLYEDVLVMERVTEYVREHYGTPQDFQALLFDPDAVDGVALDSDLRPFAEVVAGLQERVGVRNRTFLRPELSAKQIADEDDGLANLRDRVASIVHEEFVMKGLLESQKAQEFESNLISVIESRIRLLEMAEDASLLRMMALMIYKNGSLPSDRSLLYEELLAILLRRWDTPQEKGEPTLMEYIGLSDWDSRRLLPVIDRLAYEAQKTPSADGRGWLHREAVQSVLITFFEEAQLPDAWRSAHRCLDYIGQHVGLLQATSPDSFAFAHLTLQEHCAGRYLFLNSEEPIELVMQHRHDDRWRESIFLGIALADLIYLDHLLHALVEKVEDTRPKPIERWYRDLILAAEIGADRDWNYLRTHPRVKVTELQADLRTGLVELLSDASQPLPIVERVRAGFLLGNLGDPRYPVTIEQWQTEAERALNGDTGGYFCRVAPGTYFVGSSDDDPDAHDNEKPQHTVTFDQPFWIARLPLTHQQWQAWVQAGGKQSYFADDDNRNYPNQPVVGVQWYWCRDFCYWLSEQVGLAIRLPSEAEWEAVARGGDSRIYPWGNEWNDDRAATIEDATIRGTSRSTPVGCYPAGTAPCGALDLVGNLREWTHTAWTERRTTAQITEIADDAKLFVLKGGYYGEDKTNARISMRYQYRPDSDAIIGRYGFRVLLSLGISRENAHKQQYLDSIKLWRGRKVIFGLERKIEGKGYILRAKPGQQLQVAGFLSLDLAHGRSPQPGNDMNCIVHGIVEVDGTWYAQVEWPPKKKKP